MQTSLEAKIHQLKPGDHLCAIYQNSEQFRRILVPFLRDGLERREKVSYIVDHSGSAAILEMLEQAGLNTREALASGQLEIFSREETYLLGGFFDPDRMIATLRQLDVEALRAGWTALRVTGEMTWVLSKLPGWERLIEYEAKLNNFFPGSHSLALCQYWEEKFDPRLLLDVVRTHPLVISGDLVCENPFFVPPEELLLAVGDSVPPNTYRRYLSIIEERAMQQERLQKSETLFRSLYQFSPVGVELFDREGKLTTVNPACLGIFGVVEPSALLGFDLFADPNLPPSEMERIRHGQVVHYQASFDFELVKQLRLYPTTRSGVAFLDVTIAPLFSEGGDVSAGYMAQVQDITERKRAEQLQTDLILGVVHDLSNPIAAIRATLEMIPPNTDSPQTIELQAIGLRNVERLTRLTRNLLDLSKIEAGELQLKREPLELGAFLKELHQLQQPLLKEQQIESRLNLPEGAVFLSADRARLEQILVNLWSNAIKFTSQDGQISTTLARKDGQAVITVADTGRGIAPKDLPRIFERFFHGTLPESGSGLGLFIARALTEAHGGDIEAESVLGKGTTFRI
ncbi:MAG: MEDS domain-containing protein, partial [bacterium]